MQSELISIVQIEADADLRERVKHICVDINGCPFGTSPHSDRLRTDMPELASRVLTSQVE